jgi:aminomethyltransferase
MKMELKTPLYDCHVACGGKIVPFAGYLLPVQYETGVIAEHTAVRTKAGLFDVSHMGETLFSGKDALANIQKLVTNDCAGMYDGQARYSPMCNEAGGVIDDLIVYRLAEERYMIVVNAANRQKDVAWMREHLFGDVQFRDSSDETAQIALQGPKSLEILQKLAAPESIPAKYYSCVEHGTVAGFPCIVSKTGYTGEDGFELYCAPQDAPALWNTLLEAGKGCGLIPCGLGARDTLRLEAAMPLYGHEMDDTISPLETGLGFAVKMQKPDFIGKKALEEKGTPKIKRVGIQMTGRGIAREHCDVYLGEKQIGHTTSGTFCPHIGYAAAMALVDADSAELDTEVLVDIRGRKVEAKIVKLPFYKKGSSCR